MLSKKVISLILCAMMLASCLMVTTNAQARPASDWSPRAPLQLAGDYINATDPVVAMNEDGDGIVAWTTIDSSSGSDEVSVSAMTYFNGEWGPITTLSTPGVMSGLPEVAMNAHGDALVVWKSVDDNGVYLQATSFTAGTWGGVQNITDPVGKMRQHLVAFNDAGDGAVVWESNEDMGPVTVMAVTCSGGSWGTAQVISDAALDSDSPAMAMNAHGNIVAVWNQHEGEDNMLAAAFCTDGVWGAPENITSRGYDYENADVAMDDNGNVVLACQRYDGSAYVIQTMAFIAGPGLWEPMQIFSDDRDLYQPLVRMNADATLCVIGWMVDSDSFNYMNATVFTGESWTPVAQISSGTLDADNLCFDLNNHGEIMALWVEYDGEFAYIASSTFSNGAWNNVQVVSEGYVDTVRMALGGDGHAIAVWTGITDLVNSYTSTFFSVYTPPVVLPTVSITSPADDLINSTGSVTVEWSGTNVDHYTVSVNGATPLNFGKVTTATLTGLDDGEYNVNVTAYASRGESSYARVNFVVDTTVPTVAITHPAFGAWYNTSSMNVTWSVTDAGSGIANVSISLDGGAWTDVATNYYVFTDLADGQHNVSVRAYDNAGNHRVSYKIFNIDTTLPVLSITDPENDTLVNTTSVELVWGSSAASPIGRYWLSIDGGEFIDVGLNTSRVLSGLEEGKHTVVLKARDFAGNYNTTSVEFSVDSIAPAIDVISPADGLHTTERDLTMEWTVMEEGSQLRDMEISVDGGEWTILSEYSYALHDLADGAHTIAIRATDNAGNAAVRTIEVFVDNQAPTAIIAPSGDKVAVSSAIVVQFSEAMNQTSVSIVVDGVTGTVTWNGNIATFTPSAALAYGTGYTVTVSGKDLAGNEMTGESSFTTLKNECTISGMVKDKDGNAVANATVTLSNGMTATTDANGRFAFTGVPSGSYTLNVTKDGFQTLTMTVSAVAGEDIEMQTMSVTRDAAGSSDDGTMWIVGIIGVAVVAVLGVAFVMYRKKKA